MGDYFEFKGKFAQIHYSLMRKSRFEKEEVTRYNLVFESVEDLRTLLGMGAEESVLLEDESILFSQFENTYLSNANRIYINREAEFMDQVSTSGVLEKLIKTGHF